MDRRLINGLRSHPGVHEWTARELRSEALQTYLIGTDVENVREDARVAYRVEIFNDHLVDGEPRRGRVVLPMTMADLDRLHEVLDSAVTMAGLVHNPPWRLPDAAPVAEVPLADPQLVTRDGMLQASREAADLIRERMAAERAGGVRLSAAELFLDRVDEELETSRGVVATGTLTHVLLEATLLARHGDRDAEHFSQAEARRLEDVELSRILEHGAQLARDRARAGPPRTRLGPVLVDESALGQLMGDSVVGGLGAFLNQSDAAAEYARISRFALGEPVFLGGQYNGDRFDARANATHPFGVRSYRVDDDGVPARDVSIIEDGVLVARPATARYAEYLDIPVTGRAGMLEVAPGPMSLAELRSSDEPMYRIVAFSSANVDALSGDFGMEIRLGYEVGPGGERPVSGGSVTGNIFEAMGSARFARETTMFAAYAGPAAIRFAALQVAGED